MLHKTRGIVLKTTKYSESSVVAQIFTDKFGIQSYLINGVRKPKAKLPLNYLQALHLLDMVVYHKPNSQLQRLSESRPHPAFKTIPYDLLKNTIVQFINEVLYKSIRHQHHDPLLFEFIYNAICWFDEADEYANSFHLSFLMKLSRFLGFAPQNTNSKHEKFFDLQEGAFCVQAPTHPYYIDREDGLRLFELMNASFEKTPDLLKSKAIRKQLLDKILVFYQLHTASFGQIKSHQILEELLS